MPKRSLMPDPIEHYVSHVITLESPLQRRLRAETARLPQAGMEIGPDQGRLLAMLVHLIGARRALEIGTFTGYSALAIAAALPEDGTLIACDINAEWTQIARQYWDEAGLSGRIKLHLGPARDTLATLIRDGAAGSFDFAFIDADKMGYDIYYEACLTLLRPGGLIALDNMLWNGTVADLRVHDPDTSALRALNLKIRDDERVESCLLTVGDGVMLARKRSAQ